jgi:hypothetical protein
MEFRMLLRCPLNIGADARIRAKERATMRSEFIVRLGLLLIVSAVAPAWADTYTLDWANECYLRSGNAYSTCFSGATGNAPSAGLYEETQTASGGGIVITRLAGTTGTYVNQWAQNTNNTVELTPANGFWETGSFGIPVGYLYNQNSGGSTPYFQLGTGCTGAFSCTTTPFNIISLQLANNTAVNINYTIEGFLNGVQVDTATGTLTTRDTFTTVNLNWNDVNTVEFVNMVGSDSWWMNNVVLSTPATVPEPGSLVLLLTVLSVVGICTHKMRGKKRSA